MDPLFAILSNPNKKGNKWKIDEFFETGVREIQGLMRYIELLDIKITYEKVLDFGCGIGRLSQALAPFFNEVYGVDIAPSMIELAKEYNRYENKCKYYLNTTDNLKIFPDNYFDLIYSNITLQHMKPRYSKHYIREFLRVLYPNGLLIFQIPSKPNNIKTMIKQIIKNSLPSLILQLYYKIRYENQPIMEMHGIKKKKIIKIFDQNGVNIKDIIQLSSSSSDWLSFRYTITKG